MSLNAAILARSPTYYFRHDDGSGTSYPVADDGSVGSPPWVGTDSETKASLDRNDSNAAEHLNARIIAGDPPPATLAIANCASVFTLVKPTDTFSLRFVVLWNEIDADNRCELVLETDGSVSYYYKNGGTEYKASSVAGLASANTTLAIGACWTGSVINVFVNGVQYNETGGSFPAADGTAGAQLSAKDGLEFREMDIDETALFSTDESSNMLSFARNAGYALISPIFYPNQVLG